MVRDRFTWFSYLILGYFTYLQASLGPLAVFLQAKFQLSYRDVGIPTSAFAIGMVLVGLFGERIVRPWAHRPIQWVWTGAIGMAVGAIALIVSPTISIVVISTCIMGFFGTLMLFMAQGTLADYHSEHRAIALTEANVITSAGAVLAPLMVGGLQSAGLGWQSALLVAVAMLILLATLFRQVQVKTTAQATAATPQRIRFPLVFWCYWFVLICNIAIEWSVIVWSGIYLKNAGMDSNLAATMGSLFFIAELGGRFLGSRLLHYMSAPRLLVISLAITTAGFLLFWLVPTLPVKSVGLFITGLGIANLFPSALAIALSTTPQYANLASARMTMAGGLAILGAPFLLGNVADAVGIQKAFSIVIVLIVVALLIIMAAQPNLRKQH